LTNFALMTERRCKAVRRKCDGDTVGEWEYLNAGIVATGNAGGVTGALDLRDDFGT